MLESSKEMTSENVWKTPRLPSNRASDVKSFVKCPLNKRKSTFPKKVSRNLCLFIYLSQGGIMRLMYVSSFFWVFARRL